MNVIILFNNYLDAWKYAYKLGISAPKITKIRHDTWRLSMIISCFYD